MKENFKLHVQKIENKDQEYQYLRLLKEYWNASMYYKIEYLKYFLKDNDKLTYVLLKKNDVPHVLLPIIVRKVIVNNIEYPYYDSISPYGYSGPLINSEVDSNELIIFWEKLDEWYNENNIISEFIRFSLNDNQINYTGTLVDSLLNIKGILCKKIEDQWTSFLPKVRNNYKKAKKSNLSFKLYQNEDINEYIIDIFEKVYTDTMLRNNADSLYFFPKSFFESLIYSESDNICIAIAYYEYSPASVELIVKKEDTIFAFLGGTKKKYFSYRPNDFLRVEIIKWAIEAGKKYYILGGGIVNGDGLYKSKKAFFPRDRDAIFYTGRKIINEEVYNKLSLLSNPNYKQIKKEVLDSSFFPYYRKIKKN